MNLREALINSGWKVLDSRTHPRAYVDVAGTRYGTLEKSEVRVALSIGFELAEEQGEPIVYLSDDHTSVIVRALIVDEDHRRQGHAKAALQELCRWADETGTRMYLEAVPIEDKPVLSKDLSRLYSDYGFQHDFGHRMVMVRREVA